MTATVEHVNVGVCSYPKHVWKADRQEPDSAPAWSLVFKESKYYPDSAKLIHAVMRRWKLMKLADSRQGVMKNDRFGWVATLNYHSSFATAEIRKGRYLSHRRGYAGHFGLVALRDRMGQYEIFFKHRGSADEATKTFADPKFQADLKRLVLGETHVTPPAKGLWQSFCKTQFANDPRCGGFNNFVKSHVSVLAILEHMQGLGFNVNVSDEGHFWDTRKLEMLAKNIGEYDAGLAALTGAMKDAVGDGELQVESAMSGRPDFEKLEAMGQTTIANLLKLIGTIK